MPGAESTRMNKLIVFSQSVQENRLVNRDTIAQRVRAMKEIGTGLREQRRESASLPQGVRKDGTSIPHCPSALLCCGGENAGNPSRLIVSWLLLVLPMRGKGDQLEEREEEKVRVSLSFFLCLELHLQNLHKHPPWLRLWLGRPLGSSFSRVVTPLGLREPPPIAPPAQEWQQLLAGHDLWFTSLCPGWWLSFSIHCVTNPYPTFTIFGYRPFLYFWVRYDTDLPQ